MGDITHLRCHQCGREFSYFDSQHACFYRTKMTAQEKADRGNYDDEGTPYPHFHEHNPLEFCGEACWLTSLTGGVVPDIQLSGVCEIPNGFRTWDFDITDPLEMEWMCEVELPIEYHPTAEVDHFELTSKCHPVDHLLMERE